MLYWNSFWISKKIIQGFAVDHDNIQASTGNFIYSVYKYVV